MHRSQCSKADTLHCEDHQCYLLRDLKTYFGFKMSELGGDDVFHCHGSGGRSDKLQVLGRQVLEMAALSVEGSVWLHAQKYRAMCTSITAGAHFVKKHLWYGKLKAADSTFLVVYLHNCVGYAVGSPKCCRDAKTWLYPLLQLLVPCKDADQCLCNSLCSVIKFPKWGTEDLPAGIAQCIHPGSAHARHFAAIGDRTLFIAALDYYSMLKLHKRSADKNAFVEKAMKFVQNADDLCYYATCFLGIPAVFQKRYPTRDIADLDVAQILKAIVGVVALQNDECDVGAAIFKSIREVLISRDMISLGENVMASADLDKFLREVDRTITSTTNVGGRSDDSSDLFSRPLPSTETHAKPPNAWESGRPMCQLPRTDTESDAHSTDQFSRTMPCTNAQSSIRVADQLTHSSSHISAQSSARSTDRRIRPSSNTDAQSRAHSTDQFSRTTPCIDAQSSVRVADQLTQSSSHTSAQSSARSTDRRIRPSSNTDAESSAHSTDQRIRLSPNTDAQSSASSTDRLVRLSPNADAQSSAGSTDQCIHPSTRTDAQSSVRRTDQLVRLSPNADAQSSACSGDHSLRSIPCTNLQSSTCCKDQQTRSLPRTVAQTTPSYTDDIGGIDMMSVASEGDLEPILSEVTLPVGRKFFAIPSHDDLSSQDDFAMPIE